MKLKTCVVTVETILLGDSFCILHTTATGGARRSGPIPIAPQDDNKQPVPNASLPTCQAMLTAKGINQIKHMLIQQNPNPKTLLRFNSGSSD